MKSLDAARRIWRPALAVYAVQLLVTFAFLVGVERVFAEAFAAKPYFDRVTGGDLAALMVVTTKKADVFHGVAWFGVAIVFAYAIASLWLIAVVIDALAGARSTRGRIFLAYVRLWFLAIPPYAVAIGAMWPAFNRSTDAWLGLAVDHHILIRKLLVGLAPGLLLLFFTACAVDYARIAIALDERPRAFRALLAGYKTLLTRRRALPMYALYLVVWVAISAIYVGVSAGLAGALLLFVLRQIVSALRFGARVVTYAGQVDVFRS